MADGNSQLQDALRDRYLLERELGRGGMATVYLARDLRHDRPVALKVLHPELAATLGPERFEREIKLVARLQHPHILPVLDSGEVSSGEPGGRQLWFTMPYVEGESLRDRLRRDQQLPLEDAIRIASETARALDYAHRHGVIHRDIKPENILLTRDGDALVADFGIGRSLDSSAPADRLTETGVLVGTAAYMSPEQAAGERQLDGRTDIYSLGVVLYELLAGEPPYTGPSTQAIIAKRFQGDVPSVRRVRPSVPEPVERVVLKALAMVPADRFGSAARLAQALSAAAPGSTGAAASSERSSRTSMAVPGGWGRAALVLGGLVLVLVLLFAWQRRQRAESASGPRLLAVLPFENQGASDDEYFADGVTDAVRGKLAALPQLRVTARSSSTQYKRTAKTPQEIGRELGVHYLLTGTVRWDKRENGQSRVQVNPELVRVATASTSGSSPSTPPSRTCSRFRPTSRAGWFKLSMSPWEKASGARLPRHPPGAWRHTTPT